MTQSRSVARGLIAASAAVAAASLIATPALATGATTAALVDGAGSAFVRNDVVQAGAKPNGTFGSESTVSGDPASAGFTSLFTDEDGQPADYLGLINDPGADGFGVGVDHGDFFLPGSPYEAWGLYAGGQLLQNNNRTTEIAGGFLPVIDPTSNAITWSADAPANGIDISQTYTAPADNQHVITIDVALTNTTGDTQTVYYIRQVDPDNSVDNVQRDGADWDGYATFNSVLAQSAAEQLVVGYSYYDNSVIGLQAADPDAVVRISDWTFPFLTVDGDENEVPVADADAAFAEYRDAFKVGYRDYLDSTIDIIVKREIAAGATAELTFDYVLDRSALSTPQPEYALDLNLEMEIGADYADVPAYLAGGGLKPNSSYTLTEFSVPNLIFTGTTLPNGNFYDETALPTDCRPGSHTLVLTGTAPNGARVSDLVTYTVDDNCVVTAFDPYAAANGAPNPETAALAETGADLTLSVALGGAAALLAVAGGVLLARSRKRALIDA